MFFPIIFSQKIFSIICCFGGVSYGFFLGSLYQVLDSYPSHWFKQDLANPNFALFNSLFPSGAFLGTILAGYSCFKFGRVKTVLLTDLLAIISIILSISSNYFETFFIGRFFMGMCSGSNYPLMLILLKEFLLDKDYLANVVYFQVSNTIGIFLSNLLSLSQNWRLAIGISFVFPVVRFVYFFILFLEKIESPLFIWNFDGVKEQLRRSKCLKLLEKLYPNSDHEEIFNNIEHKHTLLQENFFMGNMFQTDYISEILFSISILFINQSCGINQVLGYSGLFFPNHSTIVPILFSTMTVIGGLCLLFTVPPKKFHFFRSFTLGISFSKGFIRFFIGSILLTVILGGISFGIDFASSDDSYFIIFTVLGCIYLLIFQNFVGLYPFIYIPCLLPDIGVFMVLIIHSIFGMMASLTYYFGSKTYEAIFRFCFVLSILGLTASAVLYRFYLYNKKFDCDGYFESSKKREHDSLVLRESNEDQEILNQSQVEMSK